MRFVVVSRAYRFERVIERAALTAIARVDEITLALMGNEAKDLKSSKITIKFATDYFIQTFSFRPFDRIKLIRPTSFRPTLRNF